MEHDHDATEVAVGESLLEIDFNLTPRITITPRRTVRQQQPKPNEEKTAEQSNEESASLSPHSQQTGGRATIPIGFASALASAAVLQRRTIFARPPDGRRSTETALTEIENGETASPTARKKRKLATAFDLPRLIRPQPLRVRRSAQRTAIQPFYIRLAAYIFSCRYVTASQVFRRFTELLSTERTTQRHLSNMVNHGLIAVASTRGTSPNFPFAYFVTRKGIGFLKTNLPNGNCFHIPATEERRSRGQSLHSLLHELCVSEFSLMLEKTAENRGDLQLVSQERRYFRRERCLTYFGEGTRRRIEPDFGFLPAMTGERGERTLLPFHFVEMELGTHRVVSLQQKLAAYDQWAVTESEGYFRETFQSIGEQKTNTNFRLLLVACDAYGGVGDDRRLLDLFVQSVALPQKMRDRIWLTTAAELNSHSSDAAPLSAPVWFRAKDAKHWMSEFRQAAHDSPRPERRRSYTQQRTFVAKQLSSMRRHALIPSKTWRQ